MVGSEWSLFNGLVGVDYLIMISPVFRELVGGSLKIEI